MILTNLFIGASLFLCVTNEPVTFQGGAMVQATLQWVVLTNWTPSSLVERTLIHWNGQGEDPNTTTYYENGVISSNLIAFIEWKGKVSGVTLESIPFATTNRSYRRKTITVYEP